MPHTRVSITPRHDIRYWLLRHQASHFLQAAEHIQEKNARGLLLEGVQREGAHIPLTTSSNLWFTLYSGHNWAWAEQQRRKHQRWNTPRTQQQKKHLQLLPAAISMATARFHSFNWDPMVRLKGFTLKRATRPRPWSCPSLTSDLSWSADCSPALTGASLGKHQVLSQEPLFCSALRADYRQKLVTFQNQPTETKRLFSKHKRCRHLLPPKLENKWKNDHEGALSHVHEGPKQTLGAEIPRLFGLQTMAIFWGSQRPSCSNKNTFRERKETCEASGDGDQLGAGSPRIWEMVCSSLKLSLLLNHKVKVINRRWSANGNLLGEIFS